MSGIFTFNNFYLTIDSKFWNHIHHESFIRKTKLNRKNFLSILFNRIKNRSYFPSSPIDYISFNKHNKVLRLVPSFTIEDSCVYYYTVKSIEDFVAVNRVEGTYGGFRSGILKNLENDELENRLIESDYEGYYVFNKFTWSKEWKDFQKALYTYIGERNYSHFLIFDIANFYDNINLNILESKVRQVTEKQFSRIIDLMFYFLKNWNRKLEWYFPKSVGLPQEETGQSSRILSNFYLQEFDLVMFNYTKSFDQRYVRFADDMVIMSPDKDLLMGSLFEASKELSKIGLNINSSKVQVLSKFEFEEYWAFELIENLKNHYLLGVDEFINWKKMRKNFRFESVLKLILNGDVKKLNLIQKNSLIQEILDEDFFQNANEYYILKLRDLIDNDTQFYKHINSCIKKYRFNQFHYTIKNLILKKKIDETQIYDLDQRIEELKLNLFS
ncbi:MAG: hypothetical protein OHK0017_05700 [Patescibacteria group bacterium]